MTTTHATVPASTCVDCDRPLTNPRSVALRRGPRCYAKIRRALTRATTAGKLALYQPTQVTKAVQAIAECGITRVRRTTTWMAVSSRRDRAYLVDLADRTCSCPAGAHGRLCYHLAAADILAAA